MDDRRKIILVVDDNAEEREIFSAYLEFVGYKVLTAADGEEGMRRAREQYPDLVLLDLVMPVRDGWQTLERLHADPDTRDIPVMALTAQHLDRQTLEEAGFCGYLEKPLTPYQVLTEVERCIGSALASEPTPTASRQPLTSLANMQVATDARTHAPGESNVAAAHPSRSLMDAQGKARRMANRHRSLSSVRREHRGGRMSNAGD